jgi:hypothetical protein
VQFAVNSAPAHLQFPAPSRSYKPRLSARILSWCGVHQRCRFGCTNAGEAQSPRLEASSVTGLRPGPEKTLSRRPKFGSASIRSRANFDNAIMDERRSTSVTRMTCKTLCTRCCASITMMCARKSGVQVMLVGLHEWTFYSRKPKRTRSKNDPGTLAAKQLGEQLIIDIAKYQKHPQCRTLLCFVYDPQGFIANPRGIENDLNRDDEKMSVRVLITPA